MPRKKKTNGKADFIPAEEQEDFGRPKVTLAQALEEGWLPPDWRKEILSQYSMGAADVEIRAWIILKRGSFSHDLWSRWLKEEPDFSETIKMGRVLAHQWWSQHLRGMAGGQEGNPTATIFAMKNRWPDEYKDRKEVTGKVEHSHEHTAVSETDRRIAELAGTGTGDAAQKALPN